jgi:small GTP-binding protein
MTKKTFKLVFLGDTSVGKSSVITRKVKNVFDEYLEPTIGAAFLSTSIDQITLQIWDTAGQERYRSLAPMYYRGSHAAVIVYDITNYDSFKGASYWVRELYKNNSKSIIFLVGNKIDKEDSRKVSLSEVNEYSNLNKVNKIEVSAKSGENIDELFNKIAERLDEIKEENNNDENMIKNVNVFSENNPKRFRNPNCCYT